MRTLLGCIDQVGGAESQVYYYHLDHLGTPRELTDAAGRIVWSARYRAYGALALADVAEIDNPLRFQGQYYDQETGLHYNLNRYYDPQAGRFIHQDPIGLSGGNNLYRYASNPVNWVDPLGLTGKDCSNVPKGTPPPNLSPPGAGRTGAFKEAKRQSGIPTSQQPSNVGPNLDKKGNVQPGKTYEFEVPAQGGGTKTVKIRDDAGGHDFGPGDPQNRGPHFNNEAGDHFDY